jgi:predicted dehydrogenase
MNHKLAIIGFGGMGKWHYNRACGIEGLEVAGAWDILEEKREFACEKGCHIYGSLEELLSDPESDIVLVATPNDVHKELVIAALRSGKNVVCEKPVTLNSVDLQEMIDVAKETGKIFTVHQNRRWDADFLTAKKVIEEGKIGDVFRIESRVHGSRGIPGDWRSLKPYGGGMVFDWGVHLLDQALLFFPDAKVKSVFAKTTHVTTDEVDDGFYSELYFDNGVTIHVEVCTNNFINLPRWYVLGTNGTAIIRGFNLKGEIVCASGIPEGTVIPVETAAGLTKTMAPRSKETIHTEELPAVESDIDDYYKNVMAAIEGREEIIVKLDQVQRVMRLMEAIFESSEKGEVIHFE